MRARRAYLFLYDSNCFAPLWAVVLDRDRLGARGGRFCFPDISKDEAMTQNELNRAVACATGETVSEISFRGFSLLPDDPYDCGLEPIDWDWLDQSRNVAVLPSRDLSGVPR
jgi:hypothetical protein